jgi:hypothetical protein
MELRDTQQLLHRSTGDLHTTLPTRITTTTIPTMSNSSHEQQQQHATPNDELPPRPQSPHVLQIIFIGGWSPGPLNHLQSFLIRHPTYRTCTTIVEPSTAIPMPPFGGCWCWDSWILCMIVFGTGIMWLFRSIVVSLSENKEMLRHHPLLVSILYGIVLVTWFRVFAAVVVRRSIQKGIQILSKEIRQRQTDGARADRFLLIGFSWGGAVR